MKRPLYVFLFLLFLPVLLRATITIPSILFTKVVVKEKTANIRSEAKAEAAVLIIAKRDQEFVLVNARRGWFQVWSTDLNKPGWIFAKSVTRQVRK